MRRSAAHLGVMGAAAVLLSADVLRERINNPDRVQHLARFDSQAWNTYGRSGRLHDRPTPMSAPRCRRPHGHCRSSPVSHTPADRAPLQRSARKPLCGPESRPISCDGMIPNSGQIQPSRVTDVTIGVDRGPCAAGARRTIPWRRCRRTFRHDPLIHVIRWPTTYPRIFGSGIGVRDELCGIRKDGIGVPGTVPAL